MDRQVFGVNLFGQNPNAGDEYPKMLYLGEANVIVADASEEQVAVDAGYTSRVQRAALIDAGPDPRDEQIAALKAQLAEAQRPRVGRPPKALQEEVQ